MAPPDGTDGRLVRFPSVGIVPYDRLCQCLPRAMTEGTDSIYRCDGWHLASFPRSRLFARRVVTGTGLVCFVCHGGLMGSCVPEPCHATIGG